MNEYLGVSIADWETRFKEAREEGLSAQQFCKKWKMRSSNGIYYIQKFMSDPSLARLGRGKDPSTKSQTRSEAMVDSWTRRKEREKQSAYRSIQLDAPKEETSKPIFCLVVAFESKEAAFKALGQM